MPLFGLVINAELEQVDRLFVADGIWDIDVQDALGNVSKILEYDPESETSSPLQVWFDRARATMRHVSPEQFKQHKTLKNKICSSDYLPQDSGKDVLLGVFECRGLEPVGARLPFCVQDGEGDKKTIYPCTEINEGLWFRNAWNHEDQMIVARPKLEFRRL
mmetsp:Transcript_40943/g.64925  ORF Transcript_40943/g.64925 Transcript_40943/m.64925 type:complete len:161 (+) Transcript_40943:66-548(+)|eukprot:CAMPEP_0169112386 /NCGR_PEP_ID=MMETSP1015-20121227/27611_1 /TAXON_ID=342587 /ORGANISM="Karlodinium micrum, Strain CCMP2283" /LENGTH=160 /DNA_ID=CAMNT_0009174427 /DNA_START=59 /DNA_END=541 /DNA_ORIENTATION=+